MAAPALFGTEGLRLEVSGIEMKGWLKLCTADPGDSLLAAPDGVAMGSTESWMTGSRRSRDQ